jgi:uncharacterized protein (DUF4415 family)
VLANREIDFLQVADSLFDGRPTLTAPTPRGEEERFLSIWSYGRKVLRRHLDVAGRNPHELSQQGEPEMRKKSDTVRFLAKEIKATIKRGEDRTNWRKAKAVTGKKLEASIRADVHDVQAEPDWTKAIMGIPAPKDHINIRIDHDVLEWFRASGRGYQTLMNNVLRAFVQSRRGSSLSKT